ncbi:MAG: Ig-like domain-containing protein [Bacteroidetes bacterium]|nr:Ig-like domain-containing protein [Bacteroidota bacterium]
MTPLGGTKDVLPPKIVSIIPAQKSTDFASEDIVITFDEYVQLKEISKQLVISPLITPHLKLLSEKKALSLNCLIR